MSSTLAALQPGAYYHFETLEAPRYRDLFDKLIIPEDVNETTLAGIDKLYIPSRTHPKRLSAVLPHLFRFMEQGGTIIAMGETFQDKWLPNVTFHPVETNYWWWLEPHANLGVTIEKPDHPLLKGMSDLDVTWHLHGWYEPADGAQTLVTDRDNRSIFYIDETSYNGRLVITSLDPCYHHGSHFMPATTRFLDKFLPNLRNW
ncbi:hypothetical protein WJT86_03860 [Microvirga sp. W0021]|uniref:Uncharacterized protein n=1 Tax=Hohaiivirga grylli TaxID=3133970 RepID=A0ABV0BGU9_9HYPH